MGATFRLAGEVSVRRMGFGAMRITGKGIWGWPPDKQAAIALLRQVVDSGINLIDTADAYGPEVSEYLIAEALHPYPRDLVIATKGGLVRGGPSAWKTDGRPAHLKRAAENSLRRLKLDQIPLYQLHAIDDDVPLEDSVGALKELQDAGKVRFVGLSNVTVPELERAQRIVNVVTVQNRFNLSDRKHQPVLDACTAHGLGFIPWFPLAAADLTTSRHRTVTRLCEAKQATPAQIALAWLLQQSPVMLPIPGTSSADHLVENMAAEQITLTPAELDALTSAD